jgi:hypothetical protein
MLVACRCSFLIFSACYCVLCASVSLSVCGLHVRSRCECGACVVCGRSASRCVRCARGRSVGVGVKLAAVGYLRVVWSSGCVAAWVVLVVVCLALVFRWNGSFIDKRMLIWGCRARASGVKPWCVRSSVLFL